MPHVAPLHKSPLIPPRKRIKYPSPAGVSSAAPEPSPAPIPLISDLVEVQDASDVDVLPPAAAVTASLSSLAIVDGYDGDGDDNDDGGPLDDSPATPDTTGQVFIPRDPLIPSEDSESEEQPDYLAVFGKRVPFRVLYPEYGAPSSPSEFCSEVERTYSDWIDDPDPAPLLVHRSDIKPMILEDGSLFRKDRLSAKFLPSVSDDDQDPYSLAASSPPIPLPELNAGGPDSTDLLRGTASRGSLYKRLRSENGVEIGSKFTFAYVVF